MTRTAGQLIIKVLEKERRRLQRVADKAAENSKQCLDAPIKLIGLRKELSELSKKHGGIVNIPKGDIDRLADSEKVLLKIGRQNYQKLFDKEIEASLTLDSFAREMSSITFRYKLSKPQPTNTETEK